MIPRARMAFGLMGYCLRSHFQKYDFIMLVKKKKSKVLRVQWNGTFRLHRPDPIHRAFDSSCKQDTKQRYWGQQFCQMERDISVRPTEITGPVKVDHLQSWSRIFRSDQIEMVDVPIEVSGILG